MLQSLCLLPKSNRLTACNPGFIANGNRIIGRLHFFTISDIVINNNRSFVADSNRIIRLLHSGFVTDSNNVAHTLHTACFCTITQNNGSIHVRKAVVITHHQRIRGIVKLIMRSCQEYAAVSLCSIASNLVAEANDSGIALIRNRVGTADDGHSTTILLGKFAVITTQNSKCVR